MARPKNLRRIKEMPPVRSYLPAGDVADQMIIIDLEEYESIRLCDHLAITQEEAAKIMGVSRPTLTRIYSTARKKVAQAFATGSGIVFEGGKVYIDSDWYRCNNCKSLFNNYLHSKEIKCSLCRSTNIVPFQENNINLI